MSFTTVQIPCEPSPLAGCSARRRQKEVPADQLHPCQSQIPVVLLSWRAAEEVPDVGLKRGRQVSQADYVDACGAVFTGSLESHGAALGLSAMYEAFLIELNDSAKLDFTTIAQVVAALPIFGASDGSVSAVFSKAEFVSNHRELFVKAQQDFLLDMLSLEVHARALAEQQDMAIV